MKKIVFEANIANKNNKITTKIETFQPKGQQKITPFETLQLVLAMIRHLMRMYEKNCVELGAYTDEED